MTTVPVIKLKNGRKVKLGRKPPRPGRRLAQLVAYYSPELDATPPPVKTNWRAKAMPAIRRMYGNDQYGDCVVASAYHQIGLWTGNDTAQPAQATDKEVVAAYQRICGPGDEGCIITDVLDARLRDGLKVMGTPHKIDGYLALDWTNKLLVQVAIEVFGCLTLGINLPAAWDCTDCDWDVADDNIIGGHDVPAIDYDETGVQCATWGGVVTITWEAFLSDRWIEEAYVPLSPDWYNADNLAPNGIDVAKLRADLAIIEGGGVPDPGPGPGPGPIPPSGNSLVLATSLSAGTYAIGGSVSLVDAIKASLPADRVAALTAAGFSWESFAALMVSALNSGQAGKGAGVSLSWQEWLQLILALLQQFLNPPKQATITL